MQDAEQAKQAMQDELKVYAKLEKINKSQEFNDFFDLQVDTVVKKMLTCFTGTGPQNWDDFCRVRGEVVGTLFPIQQIRGAKFMQSELKRQLNEYYNTEPN